MSTLAPLPYDAPWHRELFDRFLDASLPDLLARRLPLADYRVERGDASCDVVVTIHAASNNITVRYADLPYPDADGVFIVEALRSSPEGARRTVVPRADNDDLEAATIACVGEQLHTFVAERLGQASADLPWDDALLRAWLPLDVWTAEFFADVSQMVDTTNWLAGKTHLRRLILPGHTRELLPGHVGRVCPFETPEGPNIGRIVTIARGATIRNGRLVIEIERDDPVARLGLAASMIPLLEHDESCRLLMGANMMRQWQPPTDPEPALVQTGHEPGGAPAFWCGRNLLTAFVSWGADTHEDGLVLSASASRRLGFPFPLEPGDKLSNRHGAKGVVARILPDDAMPHLPDGTPVELCYSFTGLPSRMNFGQVREAVLGRLARAEGKPAVAPPFHAPNEQALRARLQAAGFSPTGMEPLTDGKNGPLLDRTSTVGWVYWGRTAHDARDKIRVATLEGNGQALGPREYQALRAAGADHVIHALFHTQAADSPDETASPTFANLTRRLRAAGIEARRDDSGLAFAWADASETPGATGTPGATDTPGALRLARPVAHPLQRDRALREIVVDGLALPETEFVRDANARAERLLASDAPASLLAPALEQLEARVSALFEVLLDANALRPAARAQFSGRAVIAPGADLRLDQAGIPDDMAWALFGPQLADGTGDSAAVAARTPDAARALDALLARSWVLLNRQPTLSPTAILAFHPVRLPGERVVRIHPLVCNGLDADFDGDQIAVFLPLGEAAQREAGERLSVRAHMARQPGLLSAPYSGLLGGHAMNVGLAEKSRTEAGRQEIAAIVGQALPPGLLDKERLVEVISVVRERGGVDAALEAIERLMRLGFDAARRSGASLGPFIGDGLDLPAPPAGDDPDDWDLWADEVYERLAAQAARGGFEDDALGPCLLAAACGARGTLRQLTTTIAGPGSGRDVRGDRIAIRHGWRDGRTFAEMVANATESRAGLVQIHREIADAEEGERFPAGGLHVLARALRSERPGRVFARAATTGETDPLTDRDSRLLVGLPPAE